MCSLGIYSKKQVAFHDALLAQKTALKVIWTCRLRQGHPTIVVPPHVGCLRLHRGFQNCSAHTWGIWQGNLTDCNCGGTAAVHGWRAWKVSFTLPLTLLLLSCGAALDWAHLFWRKRTVPTAFDLHFHKGRWGWTNVSKVMNWAPGSCISRGNLLPISYL